MNATGTEIAISLNIAKSELSGEMIDTLDARELHETLKIGKDFSTWIKSRLEKYGFQEHVDYSPKMGNRSDGKMGKRRKDYILTLDTAKEIAMVENNEEGRKIRRYLIEVEKKYKEKLLRLDPNDSGESFVEMAKQLIATASENKSYAEAGAESSKKMVSIIEDQEREIEQLKNKLAPNSRFSVHAPYISVEDAGKEIGISRNKLYELMRQRKFLKLDNTPYKRYEGLFFVKSRVKYLTRSKTWSYYDQTFITPRGLELLKQFFS